MGFPAGKRRMRKRLVPQGFSSLWLLVVPGVNVIPKLDVAGSTPVARSINLPSTVRAETSEITPKLHRRSRNFVPVHRNSHKDRYDNQSHNNHRTYDDVSFAHLSRSTRATFII